MYLESIFAVLNKLQSRLSGALRRGVGGRDAVRLLCKQRRVPRSNLSKLHNLQLHNPSPVLAVPSLLHTAQKRDQRCLFQIYGTITCPSAVPRPSCRTRGPAEPGMEFSERIRLPRAAAEKSRPGVITPRVPHPSELDNPFPRHPVGARDRSQPGVPLPGACACDSPPRTVDPSSALEVPARVCKGPEACLTLYRCACRGPSGGRAFRGRYQC